MKRTAAVLVILVIAGLLAWGVRRRWESVARSKREAAYQSDVRSVSQVLKPGMTRREVEDYLHAKKVTYMQECCVLRTDSDSRHSMDDLAKIGEESAPWFCSRHSVYLAFEFADYKRQAGTGFQDNDLDTLKAITIYHQMEGCL